jgi:hypothetical protein
MTEKKTTTSDNRLAFGPGLPFQNNSDEVAAQIIRATAILRQKSIASGNMSFNGNGGLIADAIVISKPEIGTPGLALNDSIARDVPPPPALAEFLLMLCISSKRSESVLGDLNECFIRDCSRYSSKRAARLYWAEALRSLWPLARRAIGRGLKWAIVIDAIKRHLIG